MNTYSKDVMKRGHTSADELVTASTSSPVRAPSLAANAMVVSHVLRIIMLNGCCIMTGNKLLAGVSVVAGASIASTGSKLRYNNSSYRR